MSRTLQAGMLALVIVVGCAGTSRADWWVQYGPSYSTYRVAYYYPVYYYAPPIYACPTAIVQPASGTGGYAQPAPAPASQNKEPPLADKKAGPPKVTESRSFSPGDAKGIPSLVDANGKDVCRVGFWNVSGRDVTLTVNGQAYALPNNRNTTLTIGRAFSWHIDGRAAQPERVASDQFTHEIVIR